jgi:hypothetical protein
MAIVQSLCDKSIQLTSGKISLEGKTEKVVSEYISQMTSISEGAMIDTSDHPNRLHRMQSIIKKVTIQNESGEFTNDFVQGESIVLTVHYNATVYGQALAGSGFILESANGSRVGGFNTYMGTKPPHRLPVAGKVVFFIKDPTLTPGRFMLTVSVGPHQSFLADKIERVVVFDILPLDIYGSGYLLTPEDGVVAMKCEVRIDENSSI